MALNKINNSDKNVVAYLHKLWKSNLNNLNNIINKDNNIIHNDNNLREYIKENKDILETFGYTYYINNNEEKEFDIEEIKDENIDEIIEFKNNRITHKVAHTIVYPKHKSGDFINPENFRYMVNHSVAIKVLDRLWCIDFLKTHTPNMLDSSIFKTNIHKNSECCKNTACMNTESIENVILLDIAKAYDSFEWDITEKLLLDNISRKINPEYAKKKVHEYMCILKNRKLYYNNNMINISKSIPTGLSSSIIIITMVFDEIIYKWQTKTKYVIGRDLLLNIYVDDIYIKILNLKEKVNIVKSFINIFEEYCFYINIKKSKIDKNLKEENSFFNYIKSFFWDIYYLNTFNELKETDYYLGIPFTRDIKLYSRLILNEYNKKHNLTLLWTDISERVLNDKSISGFFRYKLEPFIKENNTNITIKNFIDIVILEN